MVTTCMLSLYLPRRHCTQLCCWVTPYILYTVSGVTKVSAVASCCMLGAMPPTAAADRYRLGLRPGPITATGGGGRSQKPLAPDAASLAGCISWRHGDTAKLAASLPLWPLAAVAATGKATAETSGNGDSLPRIAKRRRQRCALLV